MSLSTEKENIAAEGRSAIYRIAGILVLAVIMSCMMWSLSYADESWTGSGTEEQPYLIGTYDDLLELSSAVKAGNNYDEKYFRLTSDIELEKDWLPVGSLKAGESDPAKGANIMPFSGTFDGDGHTVTSASGGRALFGFVRGATIRNLCIAGSNIKGSGLISAYQIDYGPTGQGAAGVHTADIINVTIKSGTKIEGSGFVSGLASGGNTVDITGCTVEQGVIIGSGKDQSKVGSFGGEYNGTVTSCKSAATVYGIDYVGGIIGCKGQTLCNTTVQGCTFTGEVNASGSYAGGIAGAGYGGHGQYSFETAPNGVMLNVRSCLCLGSVTARDTAGGIVGYETTVQPWSESFISANLFAGTIFAVEKTYMGAIVGRFRGLDKYSTVSDNYFADGCGADRGIGGVTYLDTNCKTHETVHGENYFDTSIVEYDDKEKKWWPTVIIQGLNDNDKYRGNLMPYHNRTDDPLGADADKIAKKVTDAELKDGSVTDKLNSAPESLKNWIQGAVTPVIKGDPIIPDDPGDDKEAKARREAIVRAADLLISLEKYEDKDAYYTPASYSAFCKAEERLLNIMTDAGSKAAEIDQAAADLQKAAAALVKRKNQPMTVKASGAKKYKASALKKKAKTFKAITVKKAQGAMSYKISGNSKSKKALKLNKKTGKVTVKKGTRKGTYKLTVTVTAKGNAYYLAGSKTVTVKVKVV